MPSRLGMPLNDAEFDGKLEADEVVPGACTNCGHENPPDIPDGTCEVCDVYRQRHGYGTRREYLCELDADKPVSAS